AILPVAMIPQFISVFRFHYRHWQTGRASESRQLRLQAAFLQIPTNEVFFQFAHRVDCRCDMVARLGKEFTRILPDNRDVTPCYGEQLEGFGEVQKDHDCYDKCGEWHTAEDAQPPGLPKIHPAYEHDKSHSGISEHNERAKQERLPGGR